MSRKPIRSCPICPSCGGKKFQRLTHHKDSKIIDKKDMHVDTTVESMPHHAQDSNTHTNKKNSIAVSPVDAPSIILQCKICDKIIKLE